jgi:hypothetical protein
MTAFIMEGTTLIPAFCTAITKGEALISVVYSLFRRRGSV